MLFMITDGKPFASPAKADPTPSADEEATVKKIQSQDDERDPRATVWSGHVSFGEPSSALIIEH